ncbi:hypothetical protein GGP86_000211 [Salinibacter ruber]|uniref:hypothetical protein n=1 Tax=Salinibacter ruber TaxID=146919 RepID=UPI002168E450|nr:hypothetical protein [Salinibacter ruber]MCS3860463.1 hypothetical protein [Salinibacter ruber]
MRSRLIGLCLTGMVLLLIAPPVQAQQTDTTQLPEIAPREIEIRGERQIALPSLERQPLTGFTTPPAVPTVPPDHRPYTGTYDQPLDGLPESLPVPESVASSMAPTAEPAQGYLEGGSGRYFSRFFEGRVGVPVSPRSRLSVHGAYTGTEADPNDDIAEARVRLQHTQDAVRVDAMAHGNVQRYALHGASPSPTLPSVAEVPDRESYSAGGAVQVRRTTPNVPARATVRYDQTEYTSHFDPAPSEQTYSQQQLGLRGSATAPVPYRPRVQAQYRRSWLGEDPQTQTAYDADVSGTVSYSPIESVSVEAGAAVLAFDTPARPARSNAGSVGATFVAPVVDAEWRVNGGPRLFLRNQPRLGDTALDALYATNPYAQHAPSLRPTLETTHAEGGLTLTRGPVRMKAAAGYRYAPTYRYFNRAAQGAYQGLYRVRYDAARILEGRGEVALQGVDGVQASLGLSVRDGTLSDVDGPIPNFAAVTADALVAVSFAGGDGFLKAHGEFHGPRDAGLARTVRLDPYVSVDLEGTYAVGADLELVARAEQLSPDAPTLWANYPQPVAELSVGLRLQW